MTIDESSTDHDNSNYAVERGIGYCDSDSLYQKDVYHVFDRLDAQAIASGADPPRQTTSSSRAAAATATNLVRFVAPLTQPTQTNPLFMNVISAPRQATPVVQRRQLNGRDY